MVEAEHQELKQSKHRRFRRRGLLTSFTILLILAAGGALAWYQLVYKGPIPYKYRKQVHATLYYPQNLPPNLYVNRSSFNIPSKNVLTFILRDNKGNKFYISEEPTVNNFDFLKFKGKFESTDSIDTTNGSALIGDLGNQLVASINTPKNTWIIINTGAFTEQGSLQTIARTLHSIN